MQNHASPVLCVEAFFESLQIGAVGWKQVRVAGIPKPDGGLRPLALTQMAWRLGASEMLAQLRPWFCAWMPECLHGGLPGRSVDAIHEQLGGLLDQRAVKRTFVGCKADVRKCFDRVSPQAALAVLRWWGAPEWLAAVLEDFYAGQERWVAVAGVFASSPVGAGASLLQGCPFSPLLLNAMMGIWSRYVQTQVDNIGMGIYLDDRSLWTRGRGAVQRLEAAARTGAWADSMLGFELHPDKLESFACNVEQREALMEHADVIGIPQSDFVLLGIPYRLAGHQAFDAKDVTKELRERGRRIRRVAVNTTTRARLAGLLMISKFRFRSPWTRFARPTVRDWTSQVEAAVWGGPLATGRSAYLLWTFVGVDLHPDFAIIVTILTKHWLRLGRGGRGRRGLRVDDALAAVGWRTRGSWWLTPLGDFVTEEMSLTGFQEHLREAWRRELWRRDTKTAGALAATATPLLRPHRNFAREGRVLALRVAAAAATDGRDLERLHAPKDCPCGEPAPSRHHLTFDCRLRPWCHDRRSEQERRMLCAIVEDEGFDFPAGQDVEGQVGLLAGYLAAAEDEVLVATDGGAYLAGEHYRWRAASWAVVLASTSCRAWSRARSARLRLAKGQPLPRFARRCG